MSNYDKDGALFRIYLADFVISRVSASKKESGLETLMSANHFFNIVPKEKKLKVPYQEVVVLTHPFNIIPIIF